MEPVCDVVCGRLLSVLLEQPSFIHPLWRCAHGRASACMHSLGHDTCMIQDSGAGAGVQSAGQSSRSVGGGVAKMQTRSVIVVPAD